MRPRGESISSPQSTYVGHDGKQNPQWTHLSISAGSGGSCPSNALLPGLDAVPAASSITGSLPAPCSVSGKHVGALVPAPCSVSSKHVGASVPSTLER